MLCCGKAERMQAPRAAGSSGLIPVYLTGDLGSDLLRCQGGCGSYAAERCLQPLSNRPPEFPMAYVFTEACIKCKYMDCVEVCPVDCFYAGENMLVINPDECIDCGVCEPECPVDAILPDSEGGMEKWLEINREYAAKWPNITRKGDAPADADQWKGVADKFAQHFSAEPAKS